jgi:hypothetical protein
VIIQNTATTAAVAPVCDRRLSPLPYRAGSERRYRE